MARWKRIKECVCFPIKPDNMIDCHKIFGRFKFKYERPTLLGSISSHNSITNNFMLNPKQSLQRYLQVAFTLL